MREPDSGISGFSPTSFYVNFSTQHHGVVASRFTMVHIGRILEQTLHEKGKTVTWFAQELCCTRPNIYKIFRKENLDAELLWRASNILKLNLFALIAAEYERQSAVDKA